MDLSNSGEKIAVLFLGTIALTLFVVSLFALGRYRERYNQLPQRPVGLFSEGQFLQT